MSSDPIEVLREVYWAGWLNASTWANRDDQLDDRGSEAYKKLEGEAVRPALASLSAPKGDLTVEELVEMLGGIVYWGGLDEVCVGIQPDAKVTCRVKAAVAMLNARMAPKPESAEAVCPECNGKGWTSEAGVAFDDPVICPDCAGSGRAEHSITANESAPPRPEASDGQLEALHSLIRMWREPAPDNGEEETEFDKGCEQTYRECADALEILIGTAPQQASECPDCLNDGCACSKCNPHPGDQQPAADRVCPNTLRACRCDKYAPCADQQPAAVDEADKEGQA